jgi:hypothetical protein
MTDDIDKQSSYWYAAIRGGVDPDTKVLHSTEEDFKQSLHQLVNKAILDELQSVLLLWSAGESKQYILDRIKELEENN